MADGHCRVSPARPPSHDIGRTRMTPLGSSSCHQRGREMGRTQVRLGSARSKRSFQLTTVQTGSTSVRHCLSGLEEFDSYERVELLEINNQNIKGLPHTEVYHTLRPNCSDLEIVAKLSLKVRATDQFGRKHSIQLTFEVDADLSEDGLGDRAYAAFKVVMRIIDTVITDPDVRDVEYITSYTVQIRHGAQEGHFMTVGERGTLTMTDHGDEKNLNFTCYEFSGHDKTCSRRVRHGAGGSGGGGGGCRCSDRWPTLCVLKDPTTLRFVAVNANKGRLDMAPYPKLNTNIRSITNRDCRFLVKLSADSTNTDKFCLHPLIMENYYLCFNDVDKLKLKKCDIPPCQDPNEKRFFTFEFVNLS